VFSSKSDGEEQNAIFFTNKQRCIVCAENIDLILCKKVKWHHETYTVFGKKST